MKSNSRSVSISEDQCSVPGELGYTAAHETHRTSHFRIVHHDHSDTGRGRTRLAAGHRVPQAVRRDARVHARPADQAQSLAGWQDRALPPQRAEDAEELALRI